MAVTEEMVYDAIRTVIDPEMGFNLVAIGLIYGVKIDGAHVDVTMTLSSKGCPLHEMMKQWTRDAVLKLPDIETCDVEVVWEPEWNISMADDEVKKTLGGF